MLNFKDSTVDLLSLITSTNADINVVSFFVDDKNPGTSPRSSTTDLMTPDRQAISILTAGTNTIVSTPGASTTRNVKTIWFFNVDASLSCALTVQYSINGTLYPFMKFTLAVGEYACIDADGKLFVYDTSGGVKVGASSPLSLMSGAVLNTQFPQGITTINTARQSQVVVSGTAYYITSSGLAVPASAVNGVIVGTYWKWRVQMDKTAAGTGTAQMIIYRGTLGTTSDTADVTQTIGTQSAAVDDMELDITVVCTVAGATGSYWWTMCPKHSAASGAGFGQVIGTTSQFSGTVASVALNTASMIMGLGFKMTTGTPTISVPLVMGQAVNLS